MLQTPQNFLTFSNLPNRSHCYHFYQFFGGAGHVRSDFVRRFEEFIRQKLRFSQFWTFTPILSTLLMDFKMSIATKKLVETGILYNESMEHNIEGHMESPNGR